MPYRDARLQLAPHRGRVDAPQCRAVGGGRLTGVSVDYTLPASQARRPASFALDGVSGGPGTAQIAGAARDAARAAGFADARVECDLAGRERVLVARGG